MATALQTIQAQPITRRTLLALLSEQGLSYENLGAGVKESLECLAHSREFYDLPAAIQPELDAFAMHLHQALAALERAKRQAAG